MVSYVSAQDNAWGKTSMQGVMERECTSSRKVCVSVAIPVRDAMRLLYAGAE